MKRLIFLLVTGLICCQLANAQTVDSGSPARPKSIMLTKDSLLFKRILPARFINGYYAFDEAMREILTPYFRKSGMNHVHGSAWLILTGKITENGNIIDMTSDKASSSEFVTGLVEKLGLLPALLPALADGKPVKERFCLILDFEHGYYTFQCRFLGPTA